MCQMINPYPQNHLRIEVVISELSTLVHWYSIRKKKKDESYMKFLIIIYQKFMICFYAHTVRFLLFVLVLGT